jgi:ferredoxin--NADP+ reductase
VKMKTVIRVLAQPFGPGQVRFLGDVRVGEGGIPLDDLRTHYTAVVHATGSAIDRRLGVPGEDLPGSIGSGAIVGWYCGHPDHGAFPPLDAPGVAVVGAGNVALDVARVLARTADELAGTDVPDTVLDALHASAVRDVHVLIRRGPQHVRFTPVELRQLGDLADAEVVVHDDGLLAAGVSDEVTDRRERANLTVLAEWARATPCGASRRIHLHFLRSPVRILGADRVTGVVVERNELTPDGRVRGTGEEETLDVGLVVRAVGYTAEPIPGLPFDPATGTVPNVAGRVIESGAPVTGAYVTGWIRRGPTGVIGTNKHDAVETAGSLLADLPTLPRPPHPDPADLDRLLAAHGVRPVDWSAWLRLDAEEIRLGQARGAERIKVADLAAMLAAVHGAAATPGS